MVITMNSEAIFVAHRHLDARRPPTRKRSILRDLFSSATSAIATVVLIAVILYALPKLIDWAIIRSVWPGGDGEACRAAGGACWAFLNEKLRQILFGIYPPSEQWRPITASLLILAMGILTFPPRNWRPWLMALWCASFAVSILLMHGGFMGLALVPTADWGGLPVTLLLAVCALGLGFPFAVLLALGRRAEAPAVRYLSIIIIEVVRGVPLISLLFVASILLPLMLPQGVSVDKLLRAAIALTVFSAAYLAEIIRGGLQALPKGQIEAARALSLSWTQTTLLIVLPQAVRSVIPPLTNTAIVMIKNTSLVLIVGLYDLLSSARAALTDPNWPTPYTETYLFIAGIYFVICFGLSRYSNWLEIMLGSRDGR